MLAFQFPPHTHQLSLANDMVLPVEAYQWDAIRTRNNVYGTRRVLSAAIKDVSDVSESVKVIVSVDEREQPKKESGWAAIYAREFVCESNELYLHGLTLQDSTVYTVNVAGCTEYLMKVCVYVNDNYGKRRYILSLTHM